VFAREPIPAPILAPTHAPGTLRVRAVDQLTGDPIPWFNLIRVDMAGGSMANQEGVALVAGTGAVEQTVRFRISHVSYETSAEIAAVVPAEGVRELDVPLEPTALEAETVHVTADALPSQREATLGVTRLETDDLKGLPNPSDDVFRVVQVLPGASTGDVGNRFHLRGGGVDQMLVRLDGMELHEFFHGRDFGGIASVVPMGAIDRMAVYPAGFPAELGGRLSGAIDLELRDRGEAGLHGRVAADATSARALLEHNTDDASLLVSAREGYLDRVLGAFQHDAVVQPAYRDFLLHAVHRPDATRSISLNVLRSEDHAFYQDDVADHSIDADYVDESAWSTFRLVPASRLVFTGTLHAARSRQDRLFRADSESHEDRMRYGARLQTQVALPGRHLLAVGGRVEREQGDWSFRGDEVVTVIQDGAVRAEADYEGAHEFDRLQGSAWVQDEWEATSRLTLHGGVRATWFETSEPPVPSPRLSVSFRGPTDATLRGYWGRYDQAPSPAPTGEAGSRLLTDRRQRAEHRGVGLEKRFGDTRVGMDAYEKVFLQLDGVVARSVQGNRERHLVTRGKSHGVEMFLQRTGARANWWFAYALGRSQWTDGTETFTRDFDRLHALSVANTLQLGSHWDLGFTYAFHTGTPYTEESWSRAGASDWVLTEGLPNAERLPAYHRVDVRVRRHFQFDGWQLSVYAEALNLTNHPNVLWYAWRKYGDEGPLSDPERVTRTGVPGIPSVGMEVRF
jgi:hypothetical protein